MFQKKVTQREFEAFKEDARNLFEQIADLFEGLAKRSEEQQKQIAALEAKVAELEAKRVPVISDLTAGGDKPMTAAELMDEWMNGKPEGSEDK